MAPYGRSLKAVTGQVGSPRSRWWCIMQALSGPEGPKQKPKRDFRKDTGGLLALNPLFVMIGLILTVIVAFLLLAEFAPIFFDALADLVSAMTTTTTNSTIGDAILDVFVIVVAIVGVVLFLQLILSITDRVKE